MSIIEKLADKNILETLSLGEKLQGALVVSVLGITITFTVLVLLLFLIKSMAVIFKQNPKVESPKSAPKAVESKPEIDEFITEEEIAAVTAAIVAHTNKKNIVISSIREVKPSWRNAAKLEQVN